MKDSKRNHRKTKMHQMPVLLLTLILALMLAACGKKGNTQTEQSKPAETQETVTKGDAVQESKTTEPEEELNQMPVLSAEELYEAFINNNAEVYVVNPTLVGDAAKYIVNNRTYTLKELFEMYCESFGMKGYYSCDATLKSGYLCPTDGTQKLLTVAFRTDKGMYQGSGYRFIIRESGGELFLEWASQTNFDTYIYAYDNGLIYVEDELNMGARVLSEGFIDRTGEYHFVYSELEGYYGYTMADFSFYEDLEIMEPAELGQMEYRIANFLDYNVVAEEVFYKNAYFAVKVEEETDAYKKMLEKAAQRGFTVCSFEQLDEIIEAKYREMGENRSAYQGDFVDGEMIETEAGMQLSRLGYKPIVVDNAQQLVDALDNDVVVALSPGRYDLTEYLFSFYCNNTVIASESAFDIAEVYITEPFYNVMNFTDCYDLLIRDIVFGHDVEKGSCEGNVLGFESCFDVYVEGCNLYGCGAYGLQCYSSDITVTSTRIHDCTYGLIWADMSSIYLAKCVLDDCNGPQFDLYSTNVELAKCTLKDFRDSMFYITQDCSIDFYECTFDADIAEKIKNYDGQGYVTTY